MWFFLLVNFPIVSPTTCCSRHIWGQDSLSSFGTSEPVLPGIIRVYTFVSMVLTHAGACGGTRVVE